MLPQVLFTLGLTAYAGLHIEGAMSPVRVVTYALLLMASLAILYSLLVVLAALSVWTVRQRELYELWFYVFQLASCPPDVYGRWGAGAVLGFVLTYLIPIVTAISVPARYGAMLLETWRPVGYLLCAAGLTFMASRCFFRFALKAYRSASS